MKKISFYFILMLLLQSCSKEEIVPDNGGGGSVTTDIFTLSLDFDQRIYAVGETITAKLHIETKKISSPTFLFSAQILSGAAEILADGVSVSEGTKHEFSYYIFNQSQSSKILELKISPKYVAEVIEGDLVIGFEVCTPDGKNFIKKQLKVRITNNSVVTYKLDYNKTHTNLTDKIAISILLQKDGYSGTLRSQYIMAEGGGSIVYENKNIQSNEDFELSTIHNNIVSYAPADYGRHKIVFFFTDGFLKYSATVEIEVIKDEGVPEVVDGIYILSSKGLYYTAQNWAGATVGTAQGIAVVKAEHALLIAPTETTYLQWFSKDVAITGVGGSGDREWNIAITDFAGYNNTRAIIAAVEQGLGTAQAASYCYNYAPANPDTWHLPALGEWYFISEYFDEINECLKACKGTLLSEKKDHSYVSSTEGCPFGSKSRVYHWNIIFYFRNSQFASQQFSSHPKTIRDYNAHIRPFQNLR